MTGFTVSMDGFRHLVSDNVKELREAMNTVVRSSNILNCFYSDDDPGFTNMGDLELDLIEEADS